MKRKLLVGCVLAAAMSVASTAYAGTYLYDVSPGVGATVTTSVASITFTINTDTPIKGVFAQATGYGEAGNYDVAKVEQMVPQAGGTKTYTLQLPVKNGLDYMGEVGIFCGDKVLSLPSSLVFKTRIR